MLRTMTIAAGSALLALTLSLPAAFAQEALKLRMSSEDPASSPLPIMARAFGDALKTKLPDSNYEMFDTRQLGDETVHMQMIRTGQLDVYPMGSDAVALDPAWAVFDMPFLFKDREQVYTLLDGEVGAELAASMRKIADLEVLAFGEVGFRQITNNTRPVIKPQDLAGIRLRVPGSETRILAFTELGASPVTMNFGELYLALQNGTVDGQENPVALIKGSSLQEVQKFMSLSNHVYTPVTFVMNGAKFDALSDDQKVAVKEAAKEAAQVSREQGRAADAKIIDEFRSVMTVDDIDLAAFQAASKDIWTQISAVAGEEIAAKVIEAATK
ncbi:TRAP transporter substrate-binding protein [Tianweitania sediminis]|uniref:TRAP transporter substrate-binding protein n=1 Tax=Tianweitania sediminis TaxID=1502156 RepID=A0A8J7UIX6_9HYPH|nr:TRAP transporter substrate-binding protein [Tianweitania sediminis]MBP0440704.1 TRAP transporter substrate-binding protein [Tianweitania sediminis]